MESGKAGLSMAAREVVGLVQAELRQVEREISLEWIASVEAITTIGKYMQGSGGKRLRPTLVLLASKLIGDGGESAIRLGAVVEMIHTATLVHDDVIDDAQTRRGRASTNMKWAITLLCWRATGSTCKHSRSPCASGTSMCSTC
jgi:octaprenyl-diphosphate synthase